MIQRDGWRRSLVLPGDDRRQQKRKGNDQGPQQPSTQANGHECEPQQHVRQRSTAVAATMPPIAVPPG